MIFQIEALSKAYSIKKIFVEISSSFTDTDRIGLIGVNGTGKSTLLKIIAGIETPDSGQIIMPRIGKVVYLPQEPEISPEATILETIFQSNDPIVTLIKSYEAAVYALAIEPENLAYQNALERWTHEMTTKDAWAYERDVRGVLFQLGIKDVQALMGSLSGGLKKRVALAKALVLPSDLLILDEPTNHLDANTIEWLETHLKSRKGGLLMVTHDRYFLDRVVNRIYELDGGRLFSYPGHYSDFMIQKIERERREAVASEKNEKLYQQELAWMRAGVEARRTKQQARKQRFEVIEASRNQNSREDGMQVDVAHSRLGKTTVELEAIDFYYAQNQPLIKNFEFTLLRTDRVGIVGPNGVGKTTLLRIMTGELEPTSGHVRIGQTVKVGHFRQESIELPMEERAIVYIKSIAEFAKTQDGTSLTASQMMERFLFTGEMQWAPISKLSGGERRRLYLLGVLMSAPNILVLDEPTNDLDLSTLTVLESYLDEFPGAVIVVSHDRYFLDRTCDRLLAFESGAVKLYTGNYTDYREKVALTQKSAEIIEEQIKQTKPSVSSEVTPTAKKGKLSYNEQREYDSLDGVIDTLMTELDGLESQIATKSDDYLALEQLVKAKDACEEALLDAMTRKEILETQINGQG